MSEDVKKTEDTAPETEEAVVDAKTEEASATPEVAEEAPVEEVATDDAKDDSNDDTGEDVEVPEKFQSLVEQVENMSVLELNELVKILEKKFGVSASAVAVAGPAAGGAGEEQSEFTVQLVSDGGAKIPVMKAVKEILGLGLKEAKEMVEGAPTAVKEGVSKEEAEEIKAKIEEAGGKVELK